MADVKNKKKIAPVGLAFYGELFTRFMRVGELEKRLSAYKDFYFERKIEKPKTGVIEIVKSFNEMIAPDMFHPYPTQLRHWHTKWNRSILEQQHDGVDEIAPKNVPQVVQTRDDNGKLAIVPREAALEAGAKTLGGELLNDAFTMLKEDQDLEELYSSNELMRRRNYILNVMSHITSLVHKKQELMLKANAEKRETANFLINILRQATAGQVKPDDVELLKGSFTNGAKDEGILQNQS